MFSRGRTCRDINPLRDLRYSLRERYLLRKRYALRGVRDLYHIAPSKARYIVAE